MNLYSVIPANHGGRQVVAGSQHEAVDIFVTFEAARGRFHDSLTVTSLSPIDLDAEQAAHLLDALAFCVSGILHHDEGLGWVFSAPLCTPVSLPQLVTSRA